MTDPPQEERGGCLLPVLLTLALFVGWYLFDYRPDQKQQEQEQQERIEQQEQEEQEELDRLLNMHPDDVDALVELPGEGAYERAETQRELDRARRCVDAWEDYEAGMRHTEPGTLDGCDLLP